MTDTTDLNRAVVERFFWGTHSPDLNDVAVIDETVTEDIVCHGFPGMNPVDRESYKGWFRFFRGIFTDMATEVTAILAEGDYVAIRWRVSAEHTGVFAGLPPTGKRISFDGMVLYRLRDGRIAETWLHPNETALMQAIGALPEAA